MCLIWVRSSKKPYNNRNIRWKVVQRTENGSLVSMFKPTTWSVGVTKIARKLEAGPSWNTGFHVFITREQARKYRNECVSNRSYHGWVVIKLEVSDFVAAGEWENNGRSETWKKAKLLACA